MTELQQEKTTTTNTETPFPTASIVAILALSFIAISLLIGLIYSNPLQPDTTLPWVEKLSALNALLNSLSLGCIILGIQAIRSQNVDKHKAFMLGALIFSALFLVSYLVYHFYHGETLFQGTGFIRPIYFFILISHIVLSALVLPGILCSGFLGLTEEYYWHRKFGRYTYPVWAYVSFTGVLVFLLNQLYS